MPSCGNAGAIAVTLEEPVGPCALFEHVVVGTRLPHALGIGEAWLIDEVVDQVRYVAKKIDDGSDQLLLGTDSGGIEIRILAAEDFGFEGEERELHRKMMLLCGQQICLEGAERFLCWNAVLGDVLPSGPPSGAQHVEPGALDLIHVVIPDEDVGMFEVTTLNIAGHLRGADDWLDLAVDEEVVGVEGDDGSGAKRSVVAHQETGVVGGDFGLAFEHARVDFDETFRRRWCDLEANQEGKLRSCEVEGLLA